MEKLGKWDEMVKRKRNIAEIGRDVKMDDALGWEMEGKENRGKLK